MYTPKHVMDAIHEVFGPCALDPASPAKPVHVQAAKWFTKEDNGLKQSWRIPDDEWLFLNPPWDERSKWQKKLHDEMACRNAHRAILIVPNKRSQAFDVLADKAAIINLGLLAFGDMKTPYPLDVVCMLFGFDDETLDALLAAFPRHGIERAKIYRRNLHDGHRGTSAGFLTRIARRKGK